jgi:BirA family biotin operon repressor/biotin-[acetyl-CoA-carboxylase] ligase
MAVAPDESRPLSLMAGVAAARAMEEVSLKWPNDIMLGEAKGGGILVERNEGVVVIGLGVNLWWPDPPSSTTALYDLDPGPDRHAEIGGLWGAEMMRLMEGSGWPLGEYRAACATLGRRLTWEPDGSGRAVDIAADGGLVVETAEGSQTIYSGVVHHVRGRP